MHVVFTDEFDMSLPLVESLPGFYHDGVTIRQIVLIIEDKGCCYALAGTGSAAPLGVIKSIGMNIPIL